VPAIAGRRGRKLRLLEDCRSRESDTSCRLSHELLDVVACAVSHALPLVLVEHHAHDRAIDAASQSEISLVAIEPARWCPETNLAAQIDAAVGTETSYRKHNFLHRILPATFH
jgi:hypothetical protein